MRSLIRIPDSASGGLQSCKAVIRKSSSLESCNDCVARKLNATVTGA
jgi:hypothetical protein